MYGSIDELQNKSKPMKFLSQIMTRLLCILSKQLLRMKILLRLLINILADGGSMIHLLRIAYSTYKKEGFVGVKRQIRSFNEYKSNQSEYDEYIDSSGGGISKSGKMAIKKKIDAIKIKPLISVVMPVYNTPEIWLRAAIESVVNQIYSNWEFCIVDDASSQPHVKKVLDDYAKRYPNIKVLYRKINGNISTATNDALPLATGDFVALLDHDDELTFDALAEVAFVLDAFPDMDVLYSDQDKMDGDSNRFEPFLKPDWSPDYFRRVMYVGHLLVFRRSLLQEVKGFDPQFDKVQDYEFMFRLSEKTSRITHIPKILYHWRAIEGSLALASDEKKGIEHLQAKAVSAHLARVGIRANVHPHPNFSHRVVIEPQPRNSFPLVSIIIPTKNAPEHIGKCLDSIFSRSTYSNFEVIVVDNGTTNQEARAILENHSIKLIAFDEKFNFSRANNLGVEAAQGEYVILLNNDTEIITPSWIEMLLFPLEQEDVVVVGALLLYPDKTVQHAGVVLGCRGTADHVMRHFPFGSDGYAGSLSCTREVSAVTAACLICRRQDYMDSGGMDEYYATHYQDVDFCLRLATKYSGRVLFVPQAVLYHFEGKSRGGYYDYLDRLLLLDSWGKVISKGDPYYNPMLSLERLDYSLKRRNKVAV